MVKRYEPCHKWYAYDNEPTLEMQESAYGEYVKLETFQHEMARLQAQIDRMRKERQHLEAANAELLAALKDMVEHYGMRSLDNARAAIKKHGGAA